MPVYIYRQLGTVGLALYALMRHKLTPVASVLAFLTASTHALPRSPLPFLSLLVFFLLGTIGTRIGHARKASLTLSASGGSGAEGPRNPAQVVANSGAADVLLGLYYFGLVGERGMVAGVCAAYAAAAADTLGSEVGILGGEPRMVTAPWVKVARGTNGGVTVLGLVAGGVGSAVVAGLFGYAYGDWKAAAGISLLGLAGSLLDSVLGAMTQVTVRDRKTGRVVEGDNGRRVMVLEGGSRVRSGRDWLNNNGVNFTMTLAIGLLGLAIS